MINLAKNFLLIYALLKPYYLFSSGGLQIADIFLLMSFVLFFIASRLSPKWHSELASIIQEQRLIFIFVALTFMVNGIHFLIHPDLRFLLSSLYYVFNLVAIIIFVIFIKDKVFLSRIGSIFKFNLLLQLILWVANAGRYFDASRYMGTFNDPNQFGYYILLSFLFIYVIDVALKKRKTYVYYLLTVFLIFLSGSTGMFLGIGVFSILIAIYYIRQQLKSPYKIARRIMHSIAILLGLLILLLPISLTVSDSINDSINSVAEVSLLSRIDEKTEQASGEADTNIFEDRGLDVLAKYPHFMIYGAGEGAYGRFTMINNYGNEIHSTLPSILFYYGIVPFLIICVWIYRNIKSISPRLIVGILALFCVSFILLNQRQALFWVFIAIMPILNNKVEAMGSKKNIYTEGQ